jgi:hypothetical protein
MPLLSHDEPGPVRRFARLIVTVDLSAVGLAIIAAVCWFFVPPIDHSAAFDAQFTIDPRFFYPEQPAKNLAFEAGCLAAPVLVILSFFASRRITDSLSVSGLRWLIATGLTVHLLFWAACLKQIVYCPNPPLWIPPLWLFIPVAFPPDVPGWEWSVSLVAAGTLPLFFVNRAPSRRVRNGVMIPVLLLWLLLAPARFYAPAEITDQTNFTYHLNAVLDALSQATNGHHLLVDFPHIYGGYIELLAPFVRLFPRAIGVPLLVLAIPSVLSVLFLLLTARLLIRSPSVLLMSCLGLLSFAYLVSLPDPYYGYVTVRSFMPALGLFLATLYFKHPGAGRYLLASGVAALAPIWNLDTGLVLWGGWLVTLSAAELAARRWRELTRHLVTQATLFLAAWAAFFLYLRLTSHAWPDLHLLFYFQTLVVQAGYFCVPLLVPNVWMSLVLLYLVGLAVALIAHGRGPVRWETRMILMISLVGVGTLSYYMGRSAESNLISVCSPGVLLLGLLYSEISAPPAIRRWYLAPWLAMVLWWIFLLFMHLPVLLARGPQFVRDWRDPSVTPFKARAALVSRWVQPREKSVYFLSSQSGFYYYLSETVRPLRIPGTIELLRTRDMDVLLAAIRERRIAKLVVEQNFYDVGMYRSDVYQALKVAVAQNYQSVETSPSQRLTLYVPR